MKITLSVVEQHFVKEYSSLRYVFNRLRGIKDLKQGGLSCADMDIDGLGAEIAFCKMFNLFPTFGLSPDSGYDCKGKNGSTIDVKTTRHRNGHLLTATRTKDKPADLYVLMVGRFPTYTYKGYATAETLYKEENLTVFVKKEVYALSQDKLTCKPDGFSKQKRGEE